MGRGEGRAACCSLVLNTCSARMMLPSRAFARGPTMRFGRLTVRLQSHALARGPGSWPSRVGGGMDWREHKASVFTLLFFSFFPPVPISRVFLCMLSFCACAWWWCQARARSTCGACPTRSSPTMLVHSTHPPSWLNSLAWIVSRCMTCGYIRVVPMSVRSAPTPPLHHPLPLHLHLRPRQHSPPPARLHHRYRLMWHHMAQCEFILSRCCPPRLPWHLLPTSGIICACRSGAQGWREG